MLLCVLGVLFLLCTIRKIEVCINDSGISKHFEYINNPQSILKGYSEMHFPKALSEHLQSLLKFQNN